MMTIWNWECHKSSPRIDVLPRVLKFLGDDPFPPAGSMGEKLILTRRLLGLTQKAMAKRLGVDPATLARLEHGKSRRSSSKTLHKMAAII